MPKCRKAAYLRAVSAYRPKKVQPYRVRWTVGGDQVDYPYDLSTKTADLLTTANLLFNSVLSTPGATFLTADLKDIYLGKPMSRYDTSAFQSGRYPTKSLNSIISRPSFTKVLSTLRFAAEYMDSPKLVASPTTKSLLSLPRTATNPAP